MTLSTPRRGRYALFAAALLTAALSTGCTSGDSTQHSRPSTAPKAGDPLAKVCEGTREKCSAISVGGRVYRYTLQSRATVPDTRHGGTVTPSPTSPTSQPSTPATLTDAVLVDLGGPGLSLFNTNASITLAKVWPGSETLIFLEEPWVTREVPAACTRALSSHYQGLRAGSDTAGDDVRGACGLDTPGTWGWTPAQYRSVLDAILAKDHLRLVGAVGSSFGAARIRALRGEADLRWLIVNSPSATDLTGAEYLDQRASAVLDAIDAACPSCHSVADARRLVRTSQKVLHADPVELATRTPLIDAADVPAAAIALTYLPENEQAALVAGLPRPGTKDAEEIGRLSDSVLMRYGETDMSPAMLAYYDEICPAYTPWPKGPAPRDPVAGLFHRIHGPCAGVTPAPGAPRPPDVASCLAYSTRDSVTPPAFARSWKTLLRRPIVLTTSSTEHARKASITSCYRRLTGRATDPDHP